MHPTFDRLGALLLLAGTQKRTLRKSGGNVPSLLLPTWSPLGRERR